MAFTYDSAECVLKLSTKGCVRAAVACGWRQVSAACLPKFAPMTPSRNIAMLVLFVCSTRSRSDDILVASHHQSHRVPYLLPISLCILPRFGSSTWILRSHVHGDRGLEAELLDTVQQVEVRQSPSTPPSTASSQIVLLSKPCILLLQRLQYLHEGEDMVGRVPVPRYCAGSEMVCWRSCWPVFVALRSFSTWSFQCVVLCQCLCIAFGSNLLVFLLASALYHCVPSQNLSRRAPR